MQWKYWTTSLQPPHINIILFSFPADEIYSTAIKQSWWKSRFWTGIHFYTTDVVRSSLSKQSRWRSEISLNYMKTDREEKQVKQEEESSKDFTKMLFL